MKRVKWQTGYDYPTLQDLFELELVLSESERRKLGYLLINTNYIPDIKMSLEQRLIYEKAFKAGYLAAHCYTEEELNDSGK